MRLWGRRSGPISGPDAPPVASSRGGAALNAHVEAADGAAAERWFRPRPARLLGGGPSSLEAVAVHRVDAAPAPVHWHVVTYGFSELWAKESPDPALSGWGFELTLRTAGEELPHWAVDLLAGLGAYVRTSGHPFAAGHTVDLRGPAQLGGDTPITAAVLVADPVLGPLRGPYGEVEFLQVVGLTADELELCRSWDPSGVTELLARQSPLLLTDLGRGSILSDNRWSEEIARRSRSEGSSLHELRVASLRVSGRRDGVEVSLGAGAAAALGPALRRELIGEGSSFEVVGDDHLLRFAASRERSWRVDEGQVDVEVPLAEVATLASLFDGHTGRAVPEGYPGLHLRVVD